VTLEAFVVLGPAAGSVPGAPGTDATRTLVAVWDFRLGGHTLATSHLYATVSAADAQALGSGAELDLNAAAGAAARAAHAEPRASPLYTAMVRPRTGLTWGEVTVDSDLQITVAQEP
jgi:hypothetical protein